MEIVYKKVGELKPYENNPRINDEAVKYVANSIKEFGFKNPIIVDKNDVIICGHTRLLASKELNLKEVPCIVADDLTDEQVKALRLADNKVAEKSMWDFEKLQQELGEIVDIDMKNFDFDLKFDESFIDNLLENEFAGQTDGSETFSVSFSFDKQYEDEVTNYLKENGKNKIIEMILDEVRNA